MHISILGQSYDISLFPQALQERLGHFAGQDLLALSFDQYQLLCDELQDLAHDCLVWDDSEDDLVSPDYGHLVALMLEGQPID